MSETKYITFDESKETAMYVAFKNHLGKDIANHGCHQKSLSELISGYKGPEIYLDFDSEDRLYGIEIIGD